MAEALCEPAVESEDQQRELSTEDAADTDAPVIIEQESITPADAQVFLDHTVKVTACENAMSPVIVVSEEKAIDVNPHTGPPLEVDSQECKAVPSEETMDVSSTIVTENERAENKGTTEPILVTSIQNLKVSVSDADKLEEPRDTVIIQKSGVISLLESSDEEDDNKDANPSRPQAAAAQSSAPDGLFVIDTRPGLQSDELYYEDEKEKEGDTAGDMEARSGRMKELSSRIDPGLRVKELGGLYINFDGSKSKTVSNSLKKLKEQNSQDELMKKSVIGPELEKKDAVPPYRESKQAVKLKRSSVIQGEVIFLLHLELKGDLKALTMRGAMDPKWFYKKNDRDGFPKYFQVIVESPVDFYHSCVLKKDRKRTMVVELFADAEFRQ
uniref:Fcf2 pre-rRNA processing C-terminal domain-containing protein n=1 Tax=Oncorhynchus kisutch TaxID=8019 RepID=A0A8C7IEL6_ONCKI